MYFFACPLRGYGIYVHPNTSVCIYINLAHVHHVIGLQTFPDGTVAARHPDGRVEQVCVRECVSAV